MENQPLDMNAAPTMETGEDQAKESESEKKASKLVDKLLLKAKKHRERYDKKWLDWYKMFRGKQWTSARPSYRHSEVINMIFQTIQSVVPIQTDSRPRIQFIPVEPGDLEFATIMDKVCEYDWERYDWSAILRECLYDANIYGTGFGSMEYDPHYNFGEGGICFESNDPFYCYPDPNARDVNDKRSKFFIHAEPLDLEVLKSKYPDKKEFMKADVSESVKQSKTEIHEAVFKSPTDSAMYVEGQSEGSAIGSSQGLEIICDLMSDEYDEKKSTGDDGKEVFEQSLKYPNGRRIIKAAGVIVYDGAIPYEDGLIPRARLQNYVLPREFFGQSEVEQLESPQKIFNRLVSYALDVLVYMGNPIWVVDTSAGVDTDNLFNRPGMVVEKEPGSEVRREAGVQLQPFVLELIDRLQVWFENIGPTKDVTQGIRPQGITAAAAISELQDAAQTRLRLKGRLLDSFIKQLGDLYMSRVFQFYSAPRVVRITGIDGASNYFKFHVEQPEGSDKKMATVIPFVKQDNGTMAMGETKQYIISGRLDVKVSTGSELPFAKTEKINLAKVMFEAGAIDELELLKAADWPNAEAVYEASQQRKALAAQQQAMMAGPQVA